MKNYIRLDISIEPYSEDAADLTAAFLADIGFETFEQTESGLAAYIPEEDYNESLAQETLQEIPFDASIKMAATKIEGQDWNKEWEKKYFKPLVLGDGRCVVHSSFHTDYPEAEIDIVIDPKMAFGTGHHATTSLMVNYLFKTGPEGKKIVDMGTGTGILSIVASKLGATDITGIEIDPAAFENAVENASLNNADIKLKLGDATQLEEIKDVELFMANINRNIILQDLVAYVRTLSADGQLILSGFYLADVEKIEEGLKENGMEIAEINTAGDNWAAIRAVKSN